MPLSGCFGGFWFLGLGCFLVLFGCVVRVFGFTSMLVLLVVGVGYVEVGWLCKIGFWAIAGFQHSLLY